MRMRHKWLLKQNIASSFTHVSCQSNISLYQCLRISHWIEQIERWTRVTAFHHRNSYSNLQKLSSSTTTLSFEAPAKRNRRGCPQCILYFQKLESLAYRYIFVADSMGLSSFKFVQWAPKDASYVQQSAFWPFKFIQGRRFWYQSKARMRLSINPPLWLWSYLAPFLRYGD